MVNPPPQRFITLYLSDRDACCPVCRYNLRGNTSDRCPECDWKIALRLSNSRAAERLRTLAILSCTHVAITGITAIVFLVVFVSMFYDELTGNAMSANVLSWALTVAPPGVSAAFASVALLKLRKRSQRVPTTCLIAVGLACAGSLILLSATVLERLGYI